MLRICALSLLVAAAFAQDGYLRIINGVAGGPEVDIYADKVKIFSNVGYMNITNYTKFAAKFYRVEARVAGESTVLATTTFVLSEGEDFTLAVVGNGTNQKSIKLDRLIDDWSQPPLATTQLNFIHLSYNAGPVNVLVNGSITYPSVAYGESTDYIETDADVYQIMVTEDNGGKLILGPIEWNFANEQVFSIVAFGNVGDPNYPLQAVIVLDASFQTTEEH